MKLRLFFAWYDIWVGAYWSSAKRTLYICLLPMVVLSISFPPKPRKLVIGPPLCQYCKRMHYPMEACPTSGCHSRSSS